MDIRVIHTGDGSTTLFNEQLNEHYHSIHGALTESRHVFIQHGFIPALGLGKPLRILEVGLGTGLNAALTAAESETRNCAVRYVALEPFPVAEDLLYQLNYNILLSPAETAYWEQIHAQPWETENALGPYFTFQKRQMGILDITETQPFHLIYFDAFAPEKQPDMWTLPVLEKCYALLADGGHFITYCAKGQLKRDLKQCGFRVEARPGPPGKREITLAIK